VRAERGAGLGAEGGGARLRGDLDAAHVVRARGALHEALASAALPTLFMVIALNQYGSMAPTSRPANTCARAPRVADRGFHRFVTVAPMSRPAAACPAPSTDLPVLTGQRMRTTAPAPGVPLGVR